MSEPTPYQRLRAEAETPAGMRRAARRVFPPDVAKVRNAEVNRRRVEARRRASLVLKARHAEEWEALLTLESLGVDAEKGPLPGDPDLPACEAQGCVCSPGLPCDESGCDGQQHWDGSTVLCTMCAREMAEMIGGESAGPD